MCCRWNETEKEGRGSQAVETQRRKRREEEKEKERKKRRKRRKRRRRKREEKREEEKKRESPKEEKEEKGRGDPGCVPAETKKGKCRFPFPLRKDPSFTRRKR